MFGRVMSSPCYRRIPSHARMRRARAEFLLREGAGDGTDDKPKELVGLQDLRYPGPHRVPQSPYPIPRLLEQGSLLVTLLGEQRATPDALPVDEDLYLAEFLTGLGCGGWLSRGYLAVDFGVGIYGCRYVF